MGIPEDPKQLEKCLLSCAAKVIKSIDAPKEQKDDLKQDAMMHTLSNLHKYKEIEGKPFENWVLVVMRNCIKSILRKETARTRRTESLFDPDGKERLLRLGYVFDFQRELQVHWGRLMPRLTQSETRIARIFVENPAMPRAEIANRASVRNAESVRVHLNHIKKKLQVIVNTAD